MDDLFPIVSGIAVVSSVGLVVCAWALWRRFWRDMLREAVIPDAMGAQGAHRQDAAGAAAGAPSTSCAALQSLAQDIENKPLYSTRLKTAMANADAPKPVSKPTKKPAAKPRDKSKGRAR